MLRPFIRMALTLGILVWFIPTISAASWVALILASVVLTLLHMLAKPVLKLIFLPINIITLGFFSVILNVGFLLLVQYLVPGFSIQPTEVFGVSLNWFFTLILASFLISFVHSIIKIAL